MFDDIQKYIKDFKSNSDKTGKLLRKYKEEINRAEEHLSGLTKNAKIFSENAYKISSAIAREEGVNTLAKNAMFAIELPPKEFDLPIFKSRILRAIKDERVISISETGLVAINMDLVAGNISDYIEGIKIARSVLGLGGKLSPEAASAFWKKYIYGTGREGKTVSRTTKSGKRKDVTKKYSGKYIKTIEARLTALSTLAPFWHILEYGTESFGTGAGGAAYPKYGGTRFVENTRIEIQGNFADIHNRVLEEYINVFEEEAKKIEAPLKNAKAEIGKTVNSPELDYIITSKVIVERYLMNVRGILTQVSPEKLTELANRVASGDTRSYWLGGGKTQRIPNLAKRFERIIEEIFDGA